MPHPKRNRLLLLGQQALRYLLRATFDAPDVGFDNGQVLDTEAEGVQVGTLTCKIVDGTLGIESNKCKFTTQATPLWGDQGFYSQAITRVLGRGLLGTVNQDVQFSFPVSWKEAAAVGNSGHGATIALDNAGLIKYNDTFASQTIATYSASTDYQFAVVLGGYDAAWGVPWRGGQPSGSYLFGAAYLVKGGAFTDWTLLWRSSQRNVATLYACLAIYNAAGTMDHFRVPDRDLSAVLQPCALSTFATDGELDAYAPEAGPMWIENTGDWDTSGGTLRNTTAGICSFNAGISNLIYDVTVTMPASGTTPGSLIVRGSDFAGVDDDYWAIRLTPGTAASDFFLIEVNAGVETTRASADRDWVASTAYNIRVIVAGNNYWKVYQDGTERLTYTASNTFNQTATLCGLRDQGNANFTAFDNVAVFHRTWAVYDDVLNKV